MARLGRFGSALLATSFVMARAAGATTYSIAPHGDDQNPGTTAQPFQTIQTAADLAQAGDTIIVEPGQYSGFAFSYGRQQTGTQDSPITFLARPGVAIVTANAHTPDGIDVEGASWVVIDGFEVRTVQRAGIRVVSSATNSVGVIIRNNDVHDTVMWGIFTSHVDSLLIENNSVTGAQSQPGIFVSNACVSPVVRGNVLAGNAGAGLSLDGNAAQGGAGVITGALVEKNVIHDNGPGGAAGISCDGVQASRLRNNLIYAEHGSGVSLFRGDAAMPSTGNVVVNNTIVVASDGLWPLDIRNASTGNTVLDNILLDGDAMNGMNGSHGSIDVSTDSLTGFVSDYNVVLDHFTLDDVTTATLDAWRAMTKQDGSSLVASASALFVNPVANDYHLLATAPAVGGGTTTGAPADDLDGTPRVGQDDIGAYQQCCRPDAGADAGARDAAVAADSSGDVTSGDAGRDAADARDAGASDATDSASVDARDAIGAKGGASSGGCGCAIFARAPAVDLAPSIFLLIGALVSRLRRRRS
jgi:parallel beta helix pectate lyase-like protein